MITPKQWLDAEPTPNILWMHVTDVMKHILQGDTEQTKFKCGVIGNDHLAPLIDEMNIHQWDKDDYDAIVENAWKHDFRWKEQRSLDGEINLDAYIARDPLACYDWRKVWAEERTSSISVLMDIGINYYKRGGRDMKRRHEKIYKLIMDAEQEEIPIRVIAAAHMWAPEMSVKLFLIVKDYEEPIYPGIWSAFKTNTTTNDFINCIMDFLHGTHDSGNGSASKMNVSPYIHDDQLLIIESDNLTCDNERSI